MTKKILNIDAIANELEGASLFFSGPALIKEEPKPERAPGIPPPPQKAAEKPIPKTKLAPVKKQSNKQASPLASMQARTDEAMVEQVRKVVKNLGKEVVFLRLTPQEKREITAVVYTLNDLYQGEIRKTTENEIGRIAVNFLLSDYKENGESSILARVIKALNA